MLTHVTKELPQVIGSDELEIPIDWTRQSIFGHSMGGHGALTIYFASLLRFGDNTQPKQYRSASAFAPACNPTISPWGIKAFNGYLQGGVEEGKVRYDATELVAKCKSKENPVHVLVDYGGEDQFLKDGQLLPENFLKKAREVGYDEVQVRVRKQNGYDHSYYFVSFVPLRRWSFAHQYIYVLIIDDRFRRSPLITSIVCILSFSVIRCTETSRSSHSPRQLLEGLSVLKHLIGISRPRGMNPSHYPLFLECRLAE